MIFKFHELDLATGEWRDLPPYPHGDLAYCSTAKFTEGDKDMILVAGGTNSVVTWESYSNRISKYDIAAEAWTSFDYLLP